MPQKNQLPTLEHLALQAVGKFVTEVAHNLVEPICHVSRFDSEKGMALLKNSLHRLNILLHTSVPWYLYDKMATEALTCIATLIQTTKNTYSQFDSEATFMNHMNVVVNLTEVVIHSDIKKMFFSAWPKIMRHVLYNNLHRMTGLEILDLGSGSGGWRTCDIEKSIILGVTAMKNLTSFCLCFDCTDHILTVVGQNCVKLRCLDVTASRSVTDRSVSALVNCQDLKELRLYRTSITIEGYAALLKGLHKLEDMGRCDEFGSVLEFIYNSESDRGPFGLRVFQSRDVTTYHLNLLIQICPLIQHASIYHDERISDLTVLSSLDHLTELKLLSCDFFADRVKELLEVRGRNITWLHLEHVDEIDMNALVYISQFCPNIKKLAFYNCDFLEHTSLSLKNFSVPPFQYLEHILCVAECNSAHLEFLLSHCHRIKFIQLGSSTDIGDMLVAKILSINRMQYLEELKILHSDNLSMQSVRLFMSHCDNLRVLSELESWQGITETELAEFKHQLRKENINLDVRPTLSY